MKRIILSLLLAPLFFACQKDDAESLPDKTGPVFVSEYENNYGSFKLFYNAQDILTKVEYRTTDGYSPTLYLDRIVEYNYSSGKLTGYSTRQGGASTPPGAPILTTFVFDDKGYITQSMSNGVKVADWKTDAAGKPTARIISNGPSYEWEYLADGNIKFKYGSSSGIGWTNTSSGSLGFNSDSNPFYTNGTGMALYAAFGYVAGSPAHLITKNLVSTTLSESLMVNDNPPPGSTNKTVSSSTYTYTKSTDDLLTSQIQAFKREEFQNGVKTSSTNNNYTYKFTCFRK